jgi:peptidyl-prolyl cis-trans isomerase D
VQVEYVMGDGAKLESGIRAGLSESEIKEFNDIHKYDPPYVLPALPVLPDALFADDLRNTLTPPPKDPSQLPPELAPDRPARFRPLEEVRELLLSDLVVDKLRDAIDHKVDPVRKVMLAYADKYSDVVEDNRDRQKRGESAKRELPPRPNLRQTAEDEGLTYVSPPPVSHEAAEKLEYIGSAHIGFTRQTEGRHFADEVFLHAETLFEPIEFVNDENRFFLAWKIADNPPRIPPLSEVREEVVRTWKLEQARPLARKAAEELAEKARKAGGKLTPEVVGDRKLVTTKSFSMLESAVLPVPGQFMPPKPRPTEIPEIPNAGDAVRQAILDLEEGQVDVEPDQPQAVFYVVGLHKRYPAPYTGLYSPYGERMRLQYEVSDEARQHRYDAWMTTLRTQAGLAPDWSPPEEAMPRSSRRREER